jgi:hypothetical protein
MEGKTGRSGHFVKKKSKDHKKFTSAEPNPISEQEHHDMLRVAKVDFSRSSFWSDRCSLIQ